MPTEITTGHRCHIMQRIVGLLELLEPGQRRATAEAALLMLDGFPRYECEPPQGVVVNIVKPNAAMD